MQPALSVNAQNIRTPDHHLRQQPTEWSRPTGYLPVTEGAVGWVHTEGDRVLPNRPGKGHPTPLSREAENVPSFLSHRAYQLPVLTSNYGFRDDMISSRYEAAAWQVERSLSGTAYGIDISLHPENPARGLFPVSHFVLEGNREIVLTEPETYTGPVEKQEEFARFRSADRQIPPDVSDYAGDETNYTKEVAATQRLNRLPISFTFGK